MTDLTLDIGDEGVLRVSQTETPAPKPPLDKASITPVVNSMEFALDNVVPSSALSIKRVADTALDKYRVVRQVGTNRAGYPNITNPLHADLVLGLTIENVDAGRETVIRMVGEVEDPSWNWTPGPIYCGVNGTLTQVPPSGIWQRQIGSAISATKLLIELRPPGATARTILSGDGDPQADLGSEGDFYIDRQYARIYGPKLNTGWPESFLTLTGPTGPQGLTGPIGPAAPVRMNVFVGDRPGPLEYLFRYIVQDPMRIQFQTSRASAEVAATYTAVFSILKNGQSVGDIVFPANSTTAIISIVDEYVVADDVLAIVASQEIDPTLAQISFLLSWEILS